MIDEIKALQVANRYFSLLSETGYVKAGLTRRILVYLFLLDFVDFTHAFFTEEDYGMVDRMLQKLFAGGSCLMPYSVFCTNRVKLGRNEYMGVMKVRKTEDDTVDQNGNEAGYTDRFTEDDYNRLV